jgi:adenylate cyclase
MRLFLLLGLMVVSQIASVYAAQDAHRMDSLKGALAAERVDTERVQLLNALSGEYRSINSDSALRYAESALRLAEERKQISGIGTALTHLGSIYRNLGDYPRALAFLRRAVMVADSSRNKKLLANALNGIGIVYIRQGSNERALETLLRSLRIAEQIGDKRDAASALDNIGVIHARQGDSARAFAALFRALSLATELQDKRMSAIALNDIAMTHRTVKQYDSSLWYCQRSLVLKKSIGDKQGSALTLNGLGLVYRLQGKYDAALEQFFQALALQIDLKFQPGVAMVLADIAQTYFKQGRFPQSIDYAERCLTVARGIGAKTELRNAYQTLANVHDSLRNPTLSYVYFRLYTAMKDSIFNEEIARRAADMSDRYESDVREQRIKLLEQERTLQRLDLERKNLVVLALVAVGVLVLGLLLVLVGRIRYRLAAEAALREKNTQLEAAHGESERLLLNMLPATIADRLKRGEVTIADRYDSVTVLFADIVGFSTISASLTPEELITLLDSIFSDIDAIANRYTLEKIKTVGDSYMLVGGLPEPSNDHVERITKAAFAIRNVIAQTAIATGIPMHMRIGVHVGAVVAGVIGKKKFVYDLWGDTVNTASRMESHGEAGKIHISEEVYRALVHHAGVYHPKLTVPVAAVPAAAVPAATVPATSVVQGFVFEERGEIDIKGKGAMRTWFVEPIEQ